MFSFKMILPSLFGETWRSESIETLVTGQIFIENFNISTPIIMPVNDSVEFDFFTIIQHIFNPTRLLKIYSRSCRNILPGEIKIVNLSDPCKQQVLEKFIDANIIPFNSSLKEAYICLNNFKSNEIRNTTIQQHFFLNLKIIVYENAKLPEKDELASTSSQTTQDEEVLVIKIENDEF